MSGGYEQTEAEPSPLLQKLMDLGMTREVAERAIAVMNVECLKKMEKWTRNWRIQNERKKAQKV